MATVSFVGFLLGVLLSSVALRPSIAGHARPGIVLTSNYSAAESIGAPTIVDGLLEGNLGHSEDTRALTTAPVSRMLRGRKMGAERNLAKREVMKAKGSTTSKNAGASPSAAANCHHEGEGELDVDCELSGRGLPSGVNFVDFIPFSSDYRGAKTHPPKNN